VPEERSFLSPGAAGQSDDLRTEPARESGMADTPPRPVNPTERSSF
jgi:hypothetical protein